MNPTPEHKEQARAIQLPFPCGCLNAHEGGGVIVTEYTCEAHRAIAVTLSSRDTEVRELLSGFIHAGVEFDDERMNYVVMQIDRRDLEKARELYAKLQPGEKKLMGR